MKSKIGMGSKDNLSTAIENDVVDAGDLLLLDSDEFAWLDKDKNVHYSTPRTQSDIKVNGVTALGVDNNYTIPAGTSFDEIIKKLVQKAIPATYTKPTITLANNSGQAATSVEAGTKASVKLTATFKQNDAGAITAISILKAGTAVANGTSSPLSYASADAIQFVDGANTYTASATYKAGAVKKNNLGDDSPSGQIAAGTITSGNYTITGIRNTFYGTGVGTIPSLNSGVIRALTGKVASAAAGTSFNISVAVGQQYVVFAYPATLRDVNQIMYVETNDTGMASSFTKSTVKVAGANDYSPIDYKVYTYRMASPAAAKMTFKVTI